MADNETDQAEEAPQMQEYEVDMFGISHTVLLDAEHAERIGAEPLIGAQPVESKTRTPQNKARDAEAK